MVVAFFYMIRLDAEGIYTGELFFVSAAALKHFVIFPGIFSIRCKISFGLMLPPFFFPQIDWYNLESPRRIPVTSRIIPFLVGNLYKPSFVTGSTPRIPVTNQDCYNL